MMVTMAIWFPHSPLARCSPYPKAAWFSGTIPSPSAFFKQPIADSNWGHCRCYAWAFSKGIDTMPNDYSLSDVLERLYENQQALEAAIMELTLMVEEQGAREVGGNVRGALWTMSENTGHIRQGLARLKKLDID
jgi:hypothetical protein